MLYPRPNNSSSNIEETEQNVRNKKHAKKTTEDSYYIRNIRSKSKDTLKKVKKV